MIEWVMLAEGVSFRHAVELLKRDHLPLPPPAPDRRRTIARCRNCRRCSHATADDQKLLEIVVGYYHETLKQTPEAQQYLTARPEIGGDGRALPAGLLQSHAGLPAAGQEPRRRRAQRGRLQELGILRERAGTSTSRFAGDSDLQSNGEVVQMYGRKITRQSAAGNAVSLVPAGTTSRGVERRGADRVERNHPVRSADRRADVLVRGLSQRDHQLRSERLHRGPPGGFQKHGTKRITSPTTATRRERERRRNTRKN